LLSGYSPGPEKGLSKKGGEGGEPRGTSLRLEDAPFNGTNATKKGTKECEWGGGVFAFLRERILPDFAEPIRGRA